MLILFLSCVSIISTIKNKNMESGMEALHESQMPSPKETHSKSKEDSFDAFEKNLREENLRLFRNLRLQEMMGKIKSNEPNKWPFK